MILQSLVRYYEDLLQQNDKKPTDERIPKLGWCLARVSYMIELKEDGTVKQIISLKTEALKPQDYCACQKCFQEVENVHLHIFYVIMQNI